MDIYKQFEKSHYGRKTGLAGFCYFHKFTLPKFGFGSSRSRTTVVREVAPHSIFSGALSASFFWRTDPPSIP